MLALVVRSSMNVGIPIPIDFNTTFSGLLVAEKGDTKWTKLLEIKDLEGSNNIPKNNPYYFKIDNHKLLLTVVDQNGGGSGEGFMKVFALNKTHNWNLKDCYNFINLGNPEDYFAYSIEFLKQPKLPIEMKECNNVELISF